jgi:hypothetical protein
VENLPGRIVSFYIFGRCSYLTLHLALALQLVLILPYVRIVPCTLSIFSEGTGHMKYCTPGLRPVFIPALS